MDAHRILQLPLTHGRVDLVAWHYNQNSLFSVQSPYHGQWIHKFGENTVNKQAVVVKKVKVWSNLWKLNVPAKVKIFGWRVLHGLLPCKGILANRDIVSSRSCPACNVGCEDIKHLLFLCKRAHDIY